MWQETDETGQTDKHGTDGQPTGPMSFTGYVGRYQERYE